MVPKKELWWGQVDPSLVLALFLTSCVTWGKWFNFWVPWFLSQNWL